MLPSIRKLARPNLFWKIFLWFWLATLITLSSVVFLYSLTGQESKLVPISSEEGKLLRKTAITLQLRNIIEEVQNGPLLRSPRARRSLENTFIIDKHGSEITDKEVPEFIYSLKSFYKKKGKPATIIRDNYAYTGPEIVFSRGEHYLLFIKQKSQQHFSTVFSHLYHSISIWHFLAALGISFLVCFGLAWYLTRPIHQLQKATRAFAGGDLNARAKDFIDKRHDEFTDLAEDFDQMADQIYRIIQSQKRLLSDVSHELRSPLTRMQIAAGLAQKHANESTQHHLDRIELEVTRLDEMIGELLQVAALERGHIYEERSRFVINEMLEVLVKDAQFEAQANSKSVHFEQFGDLEFYGYYGLLASSVENILRNAIRHTPTETHVDICLRNTEQFIEIEICDQGQGVSEAHIQKIFEPFYRPTEARERTSGGTGLGLAIAKRGVEANGGLVKARNQTGSGLCVTICLPKHH
ncbi:MAG: HAMP domain-containing protein [Kangiellaceae bacterium]|nr:HAMP domain-containing protein [Kangiellaceae bacterium]